MSALLDWKFLLNKERLRPSIKPPDDLRSEFERDYGRTIFSSPFRRLQDKAQVFPLDEHDFVRTRLTHSIEVSNIAKDLANGAAIWMYSEGELATEQQVKDVAVIAATCGLIHDLGNPPFGHAGEKAISDWFAPKFDDPKFLNYFANPLESQQAQDFLRFEGNAQGIRLITRLQLFTDEYGLNLTFGTLSAACKYLAASHEVDGSRHAFSKPGYFFSERDRIDKIRDVTKTGAVRNPLTYLVEAADDIVYSALSENS